MEIFAFFQHESLYNNVYFTIRIKIGLLHMSLFLNLFIK